MFAIFTLTINHMFSSAFAKSEELEEEKKKKKKKKNEEKKEGKKEEKEEVKEQNNGFETQVGRFLQAQRPEDKEIIFVSDSRMRTLIPKMLQNAFGGIFTHGIEPARNPTTDGGHELRCKVTFVTFALL